MKFGALTHIGPLPQTDRLNFELLKIQEGGGRRLENHKNRDISAEGYRCILVPRSWRKVKVFISDNLYGCLSTQRTA